MQVIAHRGANRVALENSWSAFDMAVAGGADRIELDIYATIDGALVIMHDEYLALAEGNRHICQLARSDFAALKLANGEPIAFLDQVLKRYHSEIEFNIEIKPVGEPRGALARTKEERYFPVAECLGKLLKELKPRKRIIVSSFIDTPLLYLKKHYPTIERAFLWEKPLPLINLSFRVPLLFLQRCDTKIFHPEVSLVTSKLMNICRDHDITVVPYCPMALDDDEKTWAFLYELGVSGLCTNNPGPMKDWVRSLHRTDEA